MADKSKLARKAELNPVGRKLNKERKSLKARNHLLNAALIRVVRENSELREKLAAAEKNSLTDSLTGLGNTRYMHKEIPNLIKSALRQKQEIIYVCFIDMNKFKPINDTFGHHVGDAALKAMADALRINVRTSDLLIRPHGDEFIVIGAAGLTDELARLTERIMQCCSEVELQFTPDNDASEVIDLKLSAAVGFYSLQLQVDPENPQPINEALVNEISRRTEQLIKSADKQMLKNKVRGRT